MLQKSGRNGRIQLALPAERGLQPVGEEALLLSKDQALQVFFQ